MKDRYLTPRQAARYMRAIMNNCVVIDYETNISKIHGVSFSVRYDRYKHLTNGDIDTTNNDDYTMWFDDGSPRIRSIYRRMSRNDKTIATVVYRVDYDGCFTGGAE